MQYVREVRIMRILRKIKIWGICIICFCLSTAFTTSEAAGNESEALTLPLSFGCDKRLIENGVLIDTIDFELSESNAAITYPISKTDSDLIFVFHDVSTAVNVTLITEKESKDCVGFRGKSDTIYAKINPDLEYELELSLGVVISDDMKQMKTVDSCSGVLEVYQAAG